MVDIGGVNIVRKVFARVLLVYFFLYVFPFPLNYIPFDIGEFISESVNSFWQWLATSFAEGILGHERELSFNGRGSGDTLYDYILIPARFLLAVFLVIIWVAWDRARKSDSKIFTVFIVLIRYYVAFMMFVYGFSKIFYLQFPEMNLMNLTRTFGDSSPMGVLWKFMGHSEAYSIFTGVMEVFGGLFLLFRKTKILGAVIAFGIMLNVFVLNMAFDVPVKLFSFHLLLMALIVTLPDFKNILNFFIHNKATQPEPITPYFTEKKKRWVGYSLKIALIFYVLFTTVENKFESQKLYGKRVPKHLLYGIYDIRDYLINGDTIPPLTTDPDRWKQLIIDKKNSLVVKMDGNRIGMQHKIDSLYGTIELKPFLDGEQGYKLRYKIKDSLLFLTEIRKLDTLHLTSKKKRREDFFLINRGFSWINEYPMQR